MKDCTVLLYPWTTDSALFLPSSTSTATGARVQLLHQRGPMKHRRLSLNQKHCLVEWKKQTLADLENISYVFILNDSNYQSKRISHENSMVLERPFHFKMSPSPERQLFPFKTQFTRNSPHNKIWVPSGRLSFWKMDRQYLCTRFWGKDKTLYLAHCATLCSAQNPDSL